MAVLREGTGGRVLPLRGKVTLIGRDPVSDVIITSPKTSARHALIVHANGTYFLEDLDSVNGTAVNGKRVRQRVALRAGDTIELPGLTVTFDDSAAPGPRTVRDTVGEETPDSGTASIISSCEIGEDLRLTVKPEAKLRAVLELSRNLGNTLDLKTVLPKTLESLFALFPQADCGFILLFDEATGQLVPRAVRHRREPANRSVPLSRGIVDHVLRTGRAVLSADAGTDARFDPTQSISNLKIRSFMSVPMVGRDGNCLGVVQIDTRDRRSQFNQEDLDLLACVSLQAARTVELARLHEERRDLEAATRIQKSFLPAERPKRPGMSFFDYYAPAQHVGGDYFDYIPLPGGRLAVALGDVSGKGISAALLMARVSAAARFALATAPSIAEAVGELNRALLRTGSEERFVTLAVAVLDADDGRLTLVNAGHLPPLLRRAGQPPQEVATDAGLPLAVMDRPYEEVVIPFAPGDALLLCTDGVTEARNPSGEMYGPERLVEAVKSAPADVETLGKTVLGDVRRFAAGRPQGDDMTVVCFGRQG
jgi:sigma-B regulation protein RsbU (phosphoserine phosphatase)